MTVIKLVDRIEADAVTGRFDDPQGIMEFLSEVRRCVMTHEAKLDSINRGNDVHVDVTFDTGGAPGLREATITSWSKDTK